MSHISETRVTDCYCGKIAILKTSWTNDNPGRHFRVCPNTGGRGPALQCGFFMWVDPPMCPRGRAIIPGLLRKLKARDEEIASLKKRLRVMVAVILLLGFLLFFWFI
ncbi:DNA-(apurinic or apyrimidinic site) lyase [Handroanthus impetiginosus]|uniref:DNA-(Apurinic or apyrimidinic site) lyase n=1 Tax=Handroanthus impetiginosus TaxID=429701 RepID=A0A2G9HID3_9LAMI|nr:DNA-(apurinic or apyrimidinic site) lyase [Handroanthus impetiginosus]